MGDRDGVRPDAEEGSGEIADVALWCPRRAEIGVDVTGQYVLGLDGAERLGVAGVFRPCGLSGFQLGPHVAGEIGVGGLPGLAFRVAVNQVAQFPDNLRFRLAVEFGDERQIHHSALV
jgi:hypothetical protein